MAQSNENVNLEVEKGEQLEDIPEEENASNSKSEKKTKGRGFNNESRNELEARYSGKGGEFEALDNEDKGGPIKCTYVSL
jgi:hypothetical protein